MWALQSSAMNVKSILAIAIGLIAISCVALPRGYWTFGSTRQCDSIPTSGQDEVQEKLSAREFMYSLNENGSVMHVKGDAPVVIDVSVYMHIISLTPNAVEDKVLRKQLDILNKDYAPAGIQFHLDGITRTEHEGWARNEHKLAYRKALRAGDYSTLNIYYIDYFHHNPNNLASTTYPDHFVEGTEDFYLDGAALNVGTLPGGDFAPYNLGKTTTHEVGHWFGLLHTFEGNSCDGEGDLVDDTPVQAVAATKGCPIRQNSCPDHIGLDDVTNFMDYGDDACMDGFTAGQVRRMHKLWKQFREKKPT